MSYLHIENLYRPKAQKLLEFKWLWALEKIHGTSANIRWSDGALYFSSGGVSHDAFVALFDQEQLKTAFQEHFPFSKVIIYGEAYGGKCQKMSHTYGPELKFVAFDVKIDDRWLDVPNAVHIVVDLFALEFVHYEQVETTEQALKEARDRPSVQARRNLIEQDMPMEGIVLRPPSECTNAYGERLIAKYKRPEFSERKLEPALIDPKKLEVLAAAEAIAQEWVTPMRLTHVLDKMGNPEFDPALIPQVIAAMQEDIRREASGEIVESKDAWKAIGRHTAKLYQKSGARLFVSSPLVSTHTS